jgi:excisionase family DNA binding protein
LKLNQQTVRNWIDQGQLPAVRIGRRVRVTRSDFDRLFDESHRLGQEHESPSETISGQEFWDGSALPTPGAPT